MIELDGSYKEGGGQILRTALSLSIFLKKSFRIYNIRKNRNPSGLKPQHLHAVLLAKRLSKAKINEVGVGSEELVFTPKGIYGGYYEENIETAGSITLLFQAILFPSLFADDVVRFHIIGGTDVKNSPTIYYFTYVLLPYYRIFADIDIKIHKFGFYPKGGGEVELIVRPKYRLVDYDNFDKFFNEIKSLGPLNIDYEDINKIEVFSIASKDLKSARVCERMVKSLEENLISNIENIRVKKNIQYVDSLSTGASITLVANKKYPFGLDFVGEKGLRSEDIGKIVANKFLKIIRTKSSVDVNLSDNVILFLSILGGYFYVEEISSHLETNIWTIRNFIHDVDIKIETMERNYKVYVSR